MKRVAEGTQIVEGCGDLQDDGFRSPEPSVVTLTASGSPRTPWKCSALPPESVSVHLDRGYDSNLTKQLLEDQQLGGCGLQEGQAVPYGGHKTVGRGTDQLVEHRAQYACAAHREGQIVDFWIAFSNATIIVGRLVRETWNRYRGETRPTHRPSSIGASLVYAEFG